MRSLEEGPVPRAALLAALRPMLGRDLFLLVAERVANHGRRAKRFSDDYKAMGRIDGVCCELFDGFGI